MDDFISALKKGVAGAGKGAVLPAAGLAAGALGALGLIQYSPVGVAALDSADLAPMLLVAVLAIALPQVALPFLVGGALGYAVEGASGRPAGWKVFFDAGRKHYVNLLLAGIAAWIIYYLLAFLLTLLLSMGAAAPLFMPVMLLLGLGIMFVVLMFIEFYDIAIVSDGAGFARAFAASMAFVRGHLAMVVPFFIIVAVAKLFVQLPLFTAIFVRTMAELVANYSLYVNATGNATFNATYADSSLLAAQTASFDLSSLLAVAILQALVQAVVFAFVIAYKAEFYRWLRGIKRITDFDYDFSTEKP